MTKKEKRIGDNLDEEKKIFKKEDKKRKKAKGDNLNDSEKEQLRKCEKEGKKVIISLL